MDANRRVVVIDTDSRVRSLMVKVLRDAGLSVRGTDCPIKASAMCAVLPVDLIVTEVILRMPGEEAMRMLRHACPRSRLLITTGVPNETVHHWTGEDGVDALIKPFRAQELVGKVFEMLDVAEQPS